MILKSPPPGYIEIPEEMEWIRKDVLVDIPYGLEYVLLYAEALCPSMKEARGENLAGSSSMVQEFLGKFCTRPVMGRTNECPELRKDRIRKAVSKILEAFLNLNYWTCRDEGRLKFICPFITASQRIYFTYRHFMYQTEANPRLAGYWDQRLYHRLKR